MTEESKDEPIKKLHLWKDEMDGKGMKVITNKTKVMPIAEEDARRLRILEDGHVMSVVEVLVETRRSVLTIRNGCKRSVML